MGQKASSVSHETPINISEEMIDSLAQQLASTQPSPERQTVLDENVKASIQAQLATLRRSEAEIRLQLQAALEKENLDREKTMMAEDSGALNSNILLGDIDELDSKISKFKSRRAFEHLPDVKSSAAAVSQCFRDNPSTSLNCLEQVQEFKASVTQAQLDYFMSLPS